MTERLFAYPENLVFECSRCGGCCRQWQVMLGPGERESLKSLDWRGRAEDLVGLTVAGSDGDRAVLAQRDDGACVFLGEANQCRIHEHFGADAKPLMCRLFPFGFLPVGDRLAVDVSFACRSVSEGTGRPLKLRTPEWVKLVDGARTEDEDGDTRHRFSKKYEVTGALVWELEHYLVQLLSNRELSIVQRVEAMWEFLRLATTSDPRTDAARKLRQVMASGVVELARNQERGSAEPMDKTQRAVIFHFLFVLLNPTPPKLRTMSGKARQKEIKRRVAAADGYRFDKAFPWLDNLELDVSYQAIASVDPSYLVEGEGAELAALYLEAKIVGQRFLAEGDTVLPFIEAVPRLLLMFPMMVWTAKALAASAGSDRVAEAHVRQSLRLLDRSFGSVLLSDLPSKQRKVWQFVLLETDLPVCACADMLSGGGSP